MSRASFRPIAALAIAIMLAVALAALSLLPPREERFLIGRPGDGRIASAGLSLPSNYFGARGRWTRGDGAFTLPSHPTRATLTLRVASPADRPSDPIEVTINELQVHRLVLTTGWNEITLPADPPSSLPSASTAARDGATSLRIRSAISTNAATDRLGQGIFVARITRRTGGFDALRYAPVRTWMLMVLAWLATLAFASLLSRSARHAAAASAGIVVNTITAADAADTAGVRNATDALSAAGTASATNAAGAANTDSAVRVASSASLAALASDAATASDADADAVSVASLVGDASIASAAGAASIEPLPAFDRTPARAAHWTPGSAASSSIVLPAAIVALALAAGIGFRAPLLAHLTIVSILCWCATLGLALTRSRALVSRLSVAPTWRVAIVFLFGALLATVLLFPQALVEGRVLSQADMLLEFAPWRSHAPADFRVHDRPPLGDIPMIVHPFSAFTLARWSEGVLPLWTSGISAGQPFLATYHSALFSPFTALLALVPSLPHATVIVAVMRLLVTGLGMFLFLRALGLSRWAAAFGGLAFQLNGFSLVSLEHPFGGVLPWLPWQLLAGERLSQPHSLSQSHSDLQSQMQSKPRHRAGAIALLALTVTAAFMGGHPHGALFVSLLGGSYALARALTAVDRLRAAIAVCIAMTLGVALGAVQILPFLEYLSLSRAVTRRTFELNPYFAPLSTLITALVPNFLGNHGAGNFAGPTNYLEQQTYPGVVVWLFAIAGVACGVTRRASGSRQRGLEPQRWRIWFFATAAIFAMLVMYAAPGLHQLISMLPLLKSASLPRIGIITMASLAVLAAYGFDAMLDAVLDASRASASRRATTAIAFATAALTLIVLAAVWQRSGFLEARALYAYTSHWTWLAIWLACVILLLAIARSRGYTARSATAFAATAILALDLLLFGNGFHDLIPAEQVFPVTPEIAAVQRDPDLFRVMGLGQALLPNAALVYGLQDVRGTDGLTVARYGDLLDVALVDQGFLHLADRVGSPLINLLNVKYVFAAPNVAPPEGWFTRLTDGETPVYRNNRVLPRAFLVDGYVIRDGNAARRTLRDGLVDFRRVALLEEEPSANDRPEAAASPSLGSVGAANVTSYRDHVVEIDTDAPARRLLVLTDVHYPGWTASIDGQPATLYRANFAFRAVAVPAGRHRVVFTYRPSSVRAGFGVSGLAGVMLMAFVFYERRRIPASTSGSLTAAPSSTPPELVAR